MSVIGGVYLIISINSIILGNITSLIVISTLSITAFLISTRYLNKLLNPNILDFIFFFFNINKSNFIISKVISNILTKIFFYLISLIFMYFFLLFNAINLMDGANGILLSFLIFLYNFF